MRFDELTVKSQEAIARAQRIAQERQHQSVDPLHVLAALLEQEEGVVPPVLAKLGLAPDALARTVRSS
ncbi:MAG: hypothetical protein GX460_05900, partial [Firmicutes bacterium]|nr:hypothetical protein [Bacillota bacterium]